MKNLFVALMTLLLAEAAMAASVKFQVTQTMNKKGKVYLAIFDDARYFPTTSSRALVSKIVEVSTTQSNIDVYVELPEGHYAVSFFLDENGNGKIDKNVMGIPKERFGFSNNPRILTGPPNFSEAEIEVVAQKNVFPLKLIKLF
jgi:uncharacterized protein (DUF2141 family)